ncbi:hypothetical protein I4U23_002876 [Adineta vaga]|nr:hypothetical protein I4U23_002876 [Adineta vaga]
MYNSTNYFVFSILSFLVVNKSISESIRYFNQSEAEPWSIKKRNFTSIAIEDHESESSSSFQFCVPFHSCSKDYNHTVLLILVPIFILSYCCYYHCYEYCKVKRELAEPPLRTSHQYQCIDAIIRHQNCTTV